MAKLSDETWQSYRENEATIKKLQRLLRFRSNHPVFSALPYIHSLDIIHRDVRVESILISTEWGIKLSNFSLATQLTKKMLVCKTRVGYLSWLAPKVLSGRGYTTACDIGAVAENVIEHAEQTLSVCSIRVYGAPAHKLLNPSDPRFRHTEGLLLFV